MQQLATTILKICRSPDSPRERQNEGLLPSVQKINRELSRSPLNKPNLLTPGLVRWVEATLCGKGQLNGTALIEFVFSPQAILMLHLADYEYHHLKVSLCLRRLTLPDRFLQVDRTIGSV